MCSIMGYILYTFSDDPQTSHLCVYIGGDVNNDDPVNLISPRQSFFVQYAFTRYVITCSLTSFIHFASFQDLYAFANPFTINFF